MFISHIVAVSNNFVIGKNNKLPWKMPEDMKYFQRVTDGKIVIMGRKNYQSAGKALKNKTNIVITNDPEFSPEDGIVAHSISSALEIAALYHPEEVFIVGGGEIYKQTLSLVDRIYITMIDTEVDGDTYYPKINISDYEIISKIEKKADQNNPFNHIYYILKT